MESGKVWFLETMKRDMPKQKAEVKESEPLEDVAAVEESTANESPAGSDDQQASPSSEKVVAEAVAESVSRAEFDQLKAERDLLVDRIARMQAEFENARKRGEREKTDFRDFATGNVVENFLPVLDNFELALKSEGSADQLRSGVSLIVKQMEEVLQKMQVTAIPAIGAAFDPRVHEALGTVERDDLPDQHVAEEIRRGYKLRDRLLRPALVRVAHNPKQKSE
jgi:molecular chaperone GrpE